MMSRLLARNAIHVAVLKHVIRIAVIVGRRPWGLVVVLRPHLIRDCGIIGRRYRVINIIVVRSNSLVPFGSFLLPLVPPGVIEKRSLPDKSANRLTDTLRRFGIRAGLDVAATHVAFAMISSPIVQDLDNLTLSARPS